jgi:phosphatidylinositol-3-phosphatase
VAASRRRGKRLTRVAVLAVVATAVLSCAGAHAAAGVPDFRHVVVITFENKDESQVVGSRSAPTFTAMARRYARLTNYDGVTHPSLPNYLALVSGSTHGIHSDCTSCVVDARSLADTLGAAGRSWKAYAEGLPRPGWTGASAGLYAKKHMPFLYFRDVVSSPARRGRVVPLTQLATDLAGNALPDFALVVPNLCNSMHDCPVATGDRWLARMLPPLLRLPQTVVFVVFDEGAGGNHVPGLALGTAVRPGARAPAKTGHYGLLRTIETAWGLPLLGHSASARPITGIWR